MAGVVLNNIQKLVQKRGCNVRMLYDIDKHRYVVGGRVHYHPYNIGSNKSKRLAREQARNRRIARNIAAAHGMI